MVFHWSLRGSKSSQISRTLLSILANFRCAAVWIVSILPLISSSPRRFSRLFGTISRASTTIGITVTFMFYSFFVSLAMSRGLLSFSPSFSFTLWFIRMTNYTKWKFLLFLLIGLIFWPGLGEPLLYRSLRESYGFHFPGPLLVFAATIWISFYCFVVLLLEIQFFSLNFPFITICPVGCGCKIHQFCRGIRPPTTEYNTKQSDGEAPVMLNFWWIRSTSLLLSHPLWPGVVTPDRVLSMS